jgi:hypothetical protein
LELESRALNILDDEQEHAPSASAVVISNNSMVSPGFGGQEGEQVCSSSTDEDYEESSSGHSLEFTDDGSGEEDHMSEDDADEELCAMYEI